MLAQYIAKHKTPFEAYLLELIQNESIPDQLKESMIYSLSVGGKRLRPILLFAVLETLGLDPKKGYQTASALEMIHTYSLIHDDLPAMDDDELRRGKPTNHIVFGEATGPSGMVAGQMLDMAAENTTITLEQLKEIHANKTGRLLEFSVVAGAIIAEASGEVVELLRQFSKHIGLAFQIKDDILDVEGDCELIGKKVGSDLENGKSTYVSLTSLEMAKQMLEDEIKQALEILDRLSNDTSLLAAIANYIKERQA